MNIIPQLGTSLSIGFCSLGGMLVNQHTHASTAYTMWKLEDLSYLYLLMVGQMLELFPSLPMIWPLAFDNVRLSDWYWGLNT